MNTAARRELQAAIDFERDSYAAMQELVPELGLPAWQRAPLERRQQVAVSTYNDAQRRLARARSHADVSRRRLLPLPRWSRGRADLDGVRVPSQGGH